MSTDLPDKTLGQDWPTAYNPKETEDKIYKLWMESGFFTPENLSGDRPKKFVTCIAPPNITGELHMGHALETTLQDIIVRMKRMQGYKTLWIPGTDHAGIGAQNVVEKQLAKEGTNRHELGREKFIKRMWEWREKYGHAILEQFKKMGLSVDWTRTKFTMDPDYQKAVEKVFHHYYEKGWIYKGERVVNWCVRCATAISDLEVNYVPEKTKLYTFKYSKDFPLAITTAQPETKFGDTAVAVNPNDKRYTEYIGQEYDVNFLGVPLHIKIIADEAVDPAFGTGALGVTPAHSIIDSEIAQRNNLRSIQVIDKNARMNKEAGPYEGLKISQAREKIITDLESTGLVEKVEDYEHNLGRCERCNSVIEQLPSKQWFLKTKELAQLALKAIEEKQIKIVPERWIGPYKTWLENIRDWNISRQLWWGHKIPLEGEEDVLDTWFSSAIWPLATLGWPLLRQGSEGQASKSDYEQYYPTDFITSDRSILFLWQVRMIFSGLELTSQVPFKEMYIHATVLTKDGKRMSKSLGTGVNPLELIEKYGTDALRFGLASQSTGLQDLRFGEDLLVMGKKFANKLWNIARYIQMKLGESCQWPERFDLESLKRSNLDILEKMEQLAKEVTKQIENYSFAEAANSLYHFIWHEFADKYIEETKEKDDQETRDTLAYLLLTSLKLLHPFMPFITEEIYSRLSIQNKKLLLIEDWPS